MKMKYGYLWLALRLMKKQKLRTLTVFCGILFSSFLLSTFGRLGYYFWNQVHEGASEITEFDSTQWILIVLVMVLLLLVGACSVIFLYNLFSLTFVQKWHSMERLMTLGATQGNIIFMVITEINMIYCVAAPMGIISAFVIEKWIGVHVDFPIWMTAGILIWVFIVSCICGVKPVLYTIRKPLLYGVNKYGKNRCIGSKIPVYSVGFTSFMVKKYFRANRGHYIRIILTMIAVIVLYVPADYLINTDLRVQQSELYQKYGIRYTYTPQNYETMVASLKECQNLADANTDADSMIYVQLKGRTTIKSDLLSQELLDILNEAGWNRKEIWESDSNIYLLDDTHYEMYLHSCTMVKAAWNSGNPAAILVNHCINRESYKEGGDNLFPESSLLNPDKWHELNEVSANSDVKINYGIEELGGDTGRCVQPGLLSDEMPEGIDFTGNITVILPLSRLETICASMKDFVDVEVYGCFEDRDQELYNQLQKELNSNGIGKLLYSRKVFQDWYDSMKEIHLAMTSICMILFFIALLNVFSTIIFQYIERKRGLAMLWSLGQTENGLVRILILENMWNFVISIIVGVPVACALCYYIYGIFRYVWRIDFILPFGRISLIVTAAIIASAIAMAINYLLMKKQDFLQNIKDIT